MFPTALKKLNARQTPSQKQKRIEKIMRRRRERIAQLMESQPVL